MKINNISLENFRCYSAYRCSFNDKINVIIGRNAVGKTSLAEAVYVLGMCKSARISDDYALINHKKKHFFLEGEFCSSTMNKYKISIGYDGAKKVVKKNQTLIKKMSDYIGVVDVVWFSANDLFLLFGNPQNRRANFDRIMCQISKVYVGALSNYKKFLKERNALLKRLIFENRNEDRILLESINEMLAEEAKKIIKIRYKTINKINEILRKMYDNNSIIKELLKIEYCINVGENEYLDVLKTTLDDDLKHGNTSKGPHKDDYIFIINNKNIVESGSQGQQRNAILNMKLAEVELIYEVKKEYPILILDDVFSELDKTRKNMLINQMPNDVQIIITATSLAEIDNNIINNSNIISLEGDN